MKEGKNREGKKNERKRRTNTTDTMANTKVGNQIAGKNSVRMVDGMSEAVTVSIGTELPTSGGAGTLSAATPIIVMSLSTGIPKAYCRVQSMSTRCNVLSTESLNRWRC